MVSFMPGLLYPHSPALSWDKADHLPPFSVKVKNALSYTSTFSHILMLWCLTKHSGITFFLLLKITKLVLRMYYSTIRQHISISYLQQRVLLFVH
jgi:hypothetical protein